MWRRENVAGNSIVQSSRFDPAVGTWSVPVDLSAAGRNGISPRLAVEPSGNVTAVWTRKNDGTYAPLFERWNGTTWSVMANPAGSNPWSPFQSVACVSASDCNAVGAGTNVANIAHWNGTKWTIVQAPLPSGHDHTTLADVACAGGKCAAVAESGISVFDSPFPAIRMKTAVSSAETWA